MTIGKLNETILGVAEFAVFNAENGLQYNLPQPTGFIIDNGIEQRVQMTQNGQGEMARASSYIKGRMPTLRVVYSHIQEEIIQFKTGRIFETASKTINVPKRYLVTKSDFAAVGVGSLGYAVVADAPSTAVIKRNGLSVALVQSPVASFDPAVDDTFSVGASLAVNFSNNLVAARESVSFNTTQTASTVSISDNQVPFLAIRAIIATTRNRYIAFKADNLTINYEGSAIDTSAENIEIPFFFNETPGSCFPYEWDYLGDLTIGCNA